MLVKILVESLLFECLVNVIYWWVRVCSKIDSLFWIMFAHESHVLVSKVFWKKFVFLVAHVICHITCLVTNHMEPPHYLVDTPVSMHCWKSKTFMESCGWSTWFFFCCQEHLWKHLGTKARKRYNTQNSLSPLFFCPCKDGMKGWCLEILAFTLDCCHLYETTSRRIQMKPPQQANLSWILKYFLPCLLRSRYNVLRTLGGLYKPRPSLYLKRMIIEK